MGAASPHRLVLVPGAPGQLAAVDRGPRIRGERQDRPTQLRGKELAALAGVDGVHLRAHVVHGQLVDAEEKVATAPVGGIDVRAGRVGAGRAKPHVQPRVVGGKGLAARDAVGDPTECGVKDAMQEKDRIPRI